LQRLSKVHDKEKAHVVQAPPDSGACAHGRPGRADGVGARGAPDHASRPGEAAEKQAEKQAEQAPAPAAPASAEQSKGQEQKAAKTESTSGINATTAGVKPSNNTDKNTSCKTGGTGSSTTCTRSPHGTNPPDSSKRYGNGTTAAQIATSRGAPADTEIRGPGNSQPHKVCKKVNANGKQVWVDVHAVKSYAGVDCEASVTTQQQSQTTLTSSTESAKTSSSVSTNVTSSTSQTGSTAATGVAAGATATGGVAGAAVESGSPQPGSKSEGGGVLGAFGVAGVAAGGALPFTGFPLWLAILAAIALIGIGWTLHRTGRPATRDLV
jgi:hypothetical protein